MAARISFPIPINVIEGGLSIAHYGPIVVSEKARIGRDCRVYVGVNVGESGDGADAPCIGDDCYLGPGAKLFGGINDSTLVGANAVVNKRLPEGHCTIVGVPARRSGK